MNVINVFTEKSHQITSHLIITNPTGCLKVATRTLATPQFIFYLGVAEDISDGLHRHIVLEIAPRWYFLHSIITTFSTYASLVR